MRGGRGGMDERRNIPRFCGSDRPRWKSRCRSARGSGSECVRARRPIALPTSSATPSLIRRLRCGAALEVDIMFRGSSQGQRMAQRRNHLLLVMSSDTANMQLFSSSRGSMMSLESNSHGLIVKSNATSNDERSSVDVPAKICEISLCNSW
jgi:hypothetical protein